MRPNPEIAPPMMLADPLTGPAGLLRYPPTSAPPARSRSRLADRVPRYHSRSAAAALEKARTPLAAPPRTVLPQPHAPQGDQPRRGPSVRRALREVWPECEVLRVLTVGDRQVFTLVWEAHRASALKRGDAGRAALAAVLLAGVRRADRLVACEVRVGEQRLAAFVDAERGALLAWDTDPDVVLAGL